MIWAILILVALLAIAVAAGVLLWKSRASALRQVKQLGAELGKRDHIIKAMEAANAEASKRKDSMASGSDADRFDASLGVLHDIAGTGKPPSGG